MPETPACDADDLRITRITAAQTYPLRQSVLRAGLPAEACVFEADEAPTTTHLGAWRGERLIGIATLMREPIPSGADGRADPDASEIQEARDRSGTTHDLPTQQMRDYPAVRLRGMAVSPDARGKGVGAALLHACFDYARRSGAHLLWCNARTPAKRFYERHGLAAVGDPFNIPTAGPHVRMVINLAP
jgi:GNAT superfamily N-acetyltransferase